MNSNIASKLRRLQQPLWIETESNKHKWKNETLFFRSRLVHSRTHVCGILWLSELCCCKERGLSREGWLFRKQTNTLKKDFMNRFNFLKVTRVTPIVLINVCETLRKQFGLRAWSFSKFVRVPCETEFIRVASRTDV